MNSTTEFSAGKNNINWVGSNFKEHLYGIEFKKASTEGIETRTLPRSMNDAVILKEFGPAPVLLGDVLAFLKTANNSDWYIFYVVNALGNIWAVYAFWHGGGWRVGAHPVSGPDAWNDGSVVVSRKFLSPSEKDTQALKTLDASDFAERLEKVEAILAHYNLTEQS